MRKPHHVVMAALLLLISGLDCATVPQNANLPITDGGPGETHKKLTTLMQTPSGPRQASVPNTGIPAPPSMGIVGPATYYKHLLTLMETPADKRQAVTSKALVPAPSATEEPSREGSVPSQEPPPAVPSTPPATAKAPLPPPEKSEEVPQTSPLAVLTLPAKEETRTQEITPPPASGVEIAALVPARSAKEEPSTEGSVPSQEPPPAVPSTPPATAPLPPPEKSEKVPQTPPLAVLTLPAKEEAGTQKLTPPPASRMETAAINLGVQPPPPLESLGSKEENLLSEKLYRIGSEDVLRVSVWQNPELTMDNVTVRPDGNISLPLIKEIHATNLTPMELSDVITRNLKEYLKDPHVTVTVTQINSKKIYLVGNVLRPGAYPLRHDMTVLQALSLAGGFTTFASPREMKLITGFGTKQEIRKINYYKMIEDIELGYYMLKPGDTIVIP